MKPSTQTFTYTVNGLKEFITVNPFDGLKISFNGLSGNGTYELDKKELEYYATYHVKFNDADEKNGQLANGDELTLTASFDENHAFKNGYVVEPTTKTYTVAGLKDAQVINPFEGLEVIFDGISGEGAYHLDLINVDPYVTQNVDFVATSPTTNLENGDEITLKAEFDTQRTQERGIIIEPREQSFTVSHLAEKVLSLKGLDTTEAVETLITSLESNIATKVQHGFIDWWGNMSSRDAIVETQYKPLILNYYVKKDDPTTNYLGLLVQADYEVTITNNTWKNGELYKAGETFHDTIYHPVLAKNVSVKDGIILLPDPTDIKVMISDRDTYSDLDLAKKYMEHNFQNVTLESLDIQIAH